MKLGHLLKTPVPQLAELLRIRSHWLLFRLEEQVRASLPEALRAFAVDSSDLWDNCEYVFSSLNFSPAVGQWQPEDGGLLILRASALMDFEAVGRKDLYRLTVKIIVSILSTIDHSILLERLQYDINITGTALDWFKSYLLDGFHFVR